MNWGRKFRRAGIAAAVIAGLSSPISAQDYFYRYKGTWGPGGTTGGGTTATVNIASNPINPNVNKPFSTALSSSGAGITGYRLNPDVPWLSASGAAVSGTPSSTGTYKFRVEALNASNDVIGQSDEVTVEVLPPASISFAAGHVFPDLTVGTDANVDFKTAVTVNDLDARVPRSLAWSKTPAGDPPGLTLDPSTGVLSGRPTTAGSYPITVVATGHDATNQHLYTIKVNGVYMDVVQISAGVYHTCAVTPTGAAKCWGNNGSGQLGDGTTTARRAPVAVSGLESGVAYIAASADNTCALLTSGGVRCWGANANGQLGRGNTTSSSVPVSVSLPSTAKAIAVGNNHGGCAVLTTNEVMCWGWNGNGQLGTGAATGSGYPTPAYVIEQGGARLTGIDKVSMGQGHTCALTTAGAVRCWGANGSYQLGLGHTTQVTRVPATPTIASNVKDIAANSTDHACALLSTGGVQCWGENGFGQVGNGSLTDRPYPTDVTSLSSGVKSISTGESHTCALLESGSAKCWGDNTNGQIGDGTTARRWTPADVSGISSASSISTEGGRVNCAVVSGKAMCWGNNTSGQFGIGTTTSSNVPVPAASE